MSNKIDVSFLWDYDDGRVTTTFWINGTIDSENGLFAASSVVVSGTLLLWHGDSCMEFSNITIERALAAWFLDDIKAHRVKGLNRDLCQAAMKAAIQKIADCGAPLPWKWDPDRELTAALCEGQGETVCKYVVSITTPLGSKWDAERIYPEKAVLKKETNLMDAIRVAEEDAAKLLLQRTSLNETS